MNARNETALQQFSRDIIEIVARCGPAVATVHCKTSVGEFTGSGFLIDDHGYVITNNHVVEGAGQDLQVQFATGLAQPAELIGADVLTDLAVIRVQGPLPRPIPMRNIPPALGEVCLAMGSPLGDYTESITMGIVSGLARTIPTTRGRPLERAIQTDAAINPGNSGGPLVDTAGQAIGVNTCVDSRAVGIGFAVPGETVNWVVPQIIRYGDVRRGALGVAVATRIENVEGQLRRAPVITRVSADLADILRPGDVILALADRPVEDRADIYYLLHRNTIGTSVPMVLWRTPERIRCDVQVREFVPPAFVNPD